MNKVKRFVLERQAEIKRTCRAISPMNIEAEIEMLPQLLNDLGTANTSRFVLDSIPDDFLYLNEIFC